MSGDEFEPEFTVTVADDVPAAHREAIHASVGSMARRGAARSRRAVERGREDARLARTTSAILKVLIEGDPAASAALDEARARTDADADRSLPDPPDWPVVAVVAGDWAEAEDAVVTHQAFGAPWHYQWQWHSGTAPLRSTQDRPNGRLGLWVHADQNDTWSDAHGGFGVALTSTRVQSVAARSLRRTTHRYRVHGGSFGGSATVEGGMEMTVLEGGTLLSEARDRRFRHRVSAGERAEYEEPGWETGDGIQVDWVMVPGRVYTLNVGCWVFGEAHGGLGTASIGSASMDGLVVVITADFTD